MTTTMQFEGKAVVVTGAGSGIGRSIVRMFAAAGADVMATDLNEAAVQAVAAELSGGRNTVKAFQLDVTNKQQAGQAVSATIEAFGKLDILVNNAGVSTMNWVTELTEQEWDYNMNVNAKGVFLVTQAALPHMISQNRGKIINIASMAGRKPAPLLAHYVASKYAVVGFSQALALEVGKHNITVNAICPGFVRTSMQERELVWEGALSNLSIDEVRESYIRQTPLGRLEETEDVAKAVMLMASEWADFITGLNLDVTGGAHLI
jgi:NAD(P)-dependent dehydrogenase (short-subunit alcohol dehydrogenase family)